MKTLKKYLVGTSEKVTATTYRADCLIQDSFTVIKGNDFRYFDKWPQQKSDRLI